VLVAVFERGLETRLDHGATVAQLAGRSGVLSPPGEHHGRLPTACGAGVPRGPVSFDERDRDHQPA
jgi:hypothetical protein